MPGCGVPAASGPADSFGLDFSSSATQPARSAIIFIVDGINAQTFQSLLDEGKLPAMKKYFVDRGLSVVRAESSHPSLTMDNLTSLVTGLYPGHHGLIAAKWFDRNRLIFRHYETLTDKNKLDDDYTAATIYDQFPGGLTCSLFLQPHKGATKFYENRTSAGPAVFFNLKGLVDRIALYRFKEVMELSRQWGQFPSLCTVYQLSVNFTAYDYGASSPEYREALCELDRQFGRVLGDLQRAGKLEQTVIAFVSDHGHCDTSKHGQIHAYLRSLGLPTPEAMPTPEGWTFEQRAQHFNAYSAVSYGAGDRYWCLYLRKPVYDAKGYTLAGWIERPSAQDLRNYPTCKGKFDLPLLLAQQPYMDAVAYLAEKDCVRVVRRQGEVEFRRVWQGLDETGAREVKITYHLVSGQDPLGWAGKVPPSALAGEPLTSRQWMEETADTELPDLGSGLLSFYDGKLAGDIVGFPIPLWDFDGWRQAGHGGIRDFEVFCPMLIAGPGIPHKSLKSARTVDLVPTVLDAMGKPVPPGLDGRSLLR